MTALRVAAVQGSYELYVAVRGIGGTGSPRARTYSGQRPGRQPREVSFPQVSGHVKVRAGAYC